MTERFIGTIREATEGEAAFRAQQLARLIHEVEVGIKPYTPFQGYMPSLRWALACLEAHPDYDGVTGMQTGRLERFRDLKKFSGQ